MIGKRASAFCAGFVAAEVARRYVQNHIADEDGLWASARERMMADKTDEALLAIFVSAAKEGRSRGMHREMADAAARAWYPRGRR